MRTRPAPLILLAIIQALAPFGSIYISSVVSHQTLLDFVKTYFAAHPYEFVFGLFGVQFLAAAAVFSTKKWSVPVVILCSFYQIFSSSWEAIGSLSFSSIGLFSFAHVLNLGLILYFLLPQVREIYFNKKHRWWESRPRYLINTPASIFLGRRHGYSACKIVEISSQGVFITTPEFELQVGDIVAVEFDYEGVHEIIKAKVVLRFATQIGLRYSDLGHASKKRLKDLIRHLEYSTVERKPERVSSIDDFKSWLGIFVRSGKGVVPSIDQRTSVHDSKLEIPKPSTSKKKLDKSA